MRCSLPLLIAAVLSCLVVDVVEASLSYSPAGSTYSQNFDSLASSGTGNAWANDTTLLGWHLFRQPASTPVAITAYNAGSGSSNAGSFYSFGNDASSERALGGAASGGSYFGSPSSGAVAGWLAFSATNNSGFTLDSFTVGFNGEQWRNGGNTSAQSMVLEYGFGSTFDTVASWTAPGGNFDWSSPVTGSTAAALDGNVAGLVSGKGGTISNLSWPIGDTLWIRWIENNDAGNDHGLAIDDFTFKADYIRTGIIPEPASMLVWGGIGLLGVGLAIYKKKVA